METNRKMKKEKLEQIKKDLAEDAKRRLKEFDEVVSRFRETEIPSIYNIDGIWPDLNSTMDLDTIRLKLLDKGWAIRVINEGKGEWCWQVTALDPFLTDRASSAFYGTYESRELAIKRGIMYSVVAEKMITPYSI